VNATETPVRGFGNDTLRRGNLATVLRIVHRRGPLGLSRSELTALTGMNRSTIAGLVGELVELGLVKESEPLSRSKVGRPSPIVVASDNAVALAVNPEIDAIQLSLVTLGGRVTERARVPASSDISVTTAVELTSNAAQMLMETLASSARIVGIGIAVPGLVRAGDGLVRLAPHFGWVDEPLTALLSAALGLPASAANDASLGALAEGRFGAGRGISDLVYLNGGASGIGGGIVSGGRPLGGSAGYAGELGHTLVRSDGIVCHCGASGCLETEVRRSALLELVGLRDEDSDRLGQALLDSTSDVVHAEVSRQLGYLGIAIRTAINTLNPERIVLGGFLAALHAAAPSRLDQSIAAKPLSASGESVAIVPAELGSDILMVGAAELAFSGLLADPTTFN
jgi:predicted NBD/HSP70 family sugar kinase